MSRYIIIIVLFILTVAFSSDGAVWKAHSLGIGIVAGDPTGLSGKYWLAQDQAFDFAIAWAFGNYLHLHATYLYHFSKVIPEPEWAVYTGIGGRLKFKHCGHGERCSRFGVRMSGGIEFSYPPFEAFLEVAPIFELAPETALEIEGGIGARFFFPPIKR